MVTRTDQELCTKLHNGIINSSTEIFKLTETYAPIKVPAHVEVEHVLIANGLSKESDSTKEDHTIKRYDGTIDLEKYAEVLNTPGENGNTAVHLAVLYEKLPLLKQLLEHSAVDLNIKNIEGNAPLHIAAGLSNLNCFNLIIEHPKVDLSLKNAEGSTALHLATRMGSSDSVKRLLTQDKIKPNIQDARGKTALHYAAEYGHVDIINKLLADTRVDPSIKDNKGKTALYFARKSGCAECFADVPSNQTSFRDRLTSVFQPAPTQLPPPAIAVEGSLSSSKLPEQGPSSSAGLGGLKSSSAELKNGAGKAPKKANPSSSNTKDKKQKSAAIRM